jgi:ATP-dependent helicase HepA
MLSDHYPGLGSRAVTVTFDRADALAHEDREFLTWEHPMVRGSMELLGSGELGAAALTLCSRPDYRTGAVLIEALFLVECLAPRGFEMQRFLPPTCLRFLLDAHGEDRAGQLPHDQLQGLCLAQNRKLAETVIQSQAGRVKLLLQHATKLAERVGERIAEQARQRMEAELTAEQRRLSALSKVNPNVREDEIERLAARQQALASYLSTTRVRLDAVRLVVMR